MKKSIEVEIMGERVTLRTDEDEDHVRNVAGYVDRKMQEITRGTRPTAKSSIAMLAALNIADEYQRLKDQHEAMSQRVNLLLKRLTTNLTEEAKTGDDRFPCGVRDHLRQLLPTKKQRKPSLAASVKPPPRGRLQR